MTSLVGLWTVVLKLQVWILAVAILVFLETEVNIFGKEGAIPDNHELAAAAKAKAIPD